MAGIINSTGKNNHVAEVPLNHIQQNWGCSHGKER
jgi:hypothetical protein